MRKTILGALVLVSWGGLAAGNPPPDESFRFQFQHAGGLYLFSGGFHVNADPQLAWAVLTDYDHVSRFVANMNSRVVSREGDEVMVDQTVGGGFLFIRQEVKGILRVQEKPYDSICLEEVTHKQFGLYQGSWILAPGGPGEGLSVSYSLAAERNKATPGFVTAGLFRQAAQDLVIGMKREMNRRESVLRGVGLKTAGLKVEN